MDGGFPENPHPAPPTDPAKPGATPPEPMVRERLDAESPDGRPPTRPARRRSTALFILLFVGVAVAVMVSLYLGGGWVPLLAALALIVAFIGMAAWPAWHAAADRVHDRHVVENEVRTDLRARPR